MLGRDGGEGSSSPWQLYLETCLSTPSCRLAHHEGSVQPHRAESATWGLPIHQLPTEPAPARLGIAQGASLSYKREIISV